MNQQVTKAITLARTNYGEADRIITVLTPDYGKLRLIAKGVRRVKSKLAGGIELFSVSDITFIKGKKDIGTLVSARLAMHYGEIVKDIDRTMLGYELIKWLNTVTEDECEGVYFVLLQEAFEALHTPGIPTDLIRLWFSAGLLRLAGHTPNLHTAADGQALTENAHYTFSFDDMAFQSHKEGAYTSDHIKFLRLVFAGNVPATVQRVQGSGDLVQSLAPLITTVRNQLFGI